MFRAMALKELRETRGIVLLALLAYVCLTTREMGFRGLPWSESGEVFLPFVDNDFNVFFGLISAAFAIALGLRQTLGEAVHGTYPFLLHRPANRRWLLGVKLLVGTVAYLTCAALPILVCGLWAATPGTHAGPFQWSMTDMAWGMWGQWVLLYLAAFLCGIRLGRWLGTRLLPLAAAGGTLFWFFAAGNFGFSGTLIILLADVVMLASIFSVARHRDF